MKPWIKPAIVSGIFFSMLLVGVSFLHDNPLSTQTLGIAREMDTPRSSSNWNTFYDAIGTADGGINVTINVTETNRLNRDCLITVDASKMIEINGGISGWSDVIITHINITYPNSTVIGDGMDEIGSTNVFTFRFRTGLSSILGDYQFTFIPSTGDQNFSSFNMTGKPTPKIRIVNVLPVADVLLDREFIYRNESISFTITAFDAETKYLDLDWDLVLVASNSTQLAAWHEKDDFQQDYMFAGVGDYLLGNYTLDLTVNDADGGIAKKAVVFEVRNRPPDVLSMDYNFTSELLRHTESMKFDINMSDYEDGQSELDSVMVIFQNMVTKQNFTSAKFLFNSTTKNYTGTLTLPKTAKLDSYTIIIIAKDKDNGMTTFIPGTKNEILAMNNLPSIHGTLINGQNLTNGLRFTSRENLEVWINATDVEQLTFVELILFNEASNARISLFSSVSENKTVKLSSNLLASGTWQLFAAAYDSDNGVCAGTLIGTIEIIPDLRDETATIITVLLSIIGGFFLGGFVIWRYANSKLKDIKGELIIKGASKKEAPASGESAKKKSDTYTDIEKVNPKRDDVKKKEETSKPEKQQGTPQKPVTKKEGKGKTRF
nr:hypothetical protein [Candidatus Sigynarchaeota archaeon]